MALDEDDKQRVLALGTVLMMVIAAILCVLAPSLALNL
jgi:hypothetical protein